MVTQEIRPPFRWRARNQYYAAIAANLIVLAQGSMLGWIAPALARLTSDTTPLLSGPLTNEQVSWIGSLSGIGGAIGALSIGYFISIMGCKRVLLLLSFPSIIFWLLIQFGNSYYSILAARCITGFANGGSTASTLFISEIANDNIRGRLGSTVHVLRYVGILTGYVLGAFVDYNYIPCICIVIPIVFAIVFMILPNSPRYYLQKGKIQTAEDALKFYKGCKGKNEDENSAVHNEFERLKTISNERKTEEKLQFSDICNRSAMKSIGIGIILATCSHSTACFVMINYSVIIFERIGTTIDPYISSIVMASALTFGALLSSYLADILGRKMLNTISLLSAAVGLFTTACYHYLNEKGYDLTMYAWIPVVSLSFVIWISASGIVTLMFICSVEYLPAKIRTIGMTAITLMFNVLMFTSLKTFPILIEIVGVHGCMTIYGIGCLLGAFFVVFVMKETRGTSLDDIGKDGNERENQVQKTEI